MNYLLKSEIYDILYQFNKSAASMLPFRAIHILLQPRTTVEVLRLGLIDNKK